jgi:uncharacterized coiled-coil DUF342 family protein
MPDDPIFTACPPCKVVICGGGVVEGAQRVSAQANTLMQLFQQKKLKREEMAELVSELDEIEDEMNECAEKLREINERIAKS